MKRRGPKTGYNFDAKAEYRENVWKCFSENIADVKKAIVVFLPSKEGLEIPVALKYGFKEENLIAIDENPALIASAKWRKKYPKIKCYGSKVSRAFQRMSNDGVKINAANLDFCNNISAELIDEIYKTLDFGYFDKSFLISVTILKGREPKPTNSLLNLILEDSKSYKNSGLSKRAIVVYKIINNVLNRFYNYFIFNEFHSEYKSSTQTIEYTIFKIINKERMNEKIAFNLDKIRKREDIIELDKKSKECEKIRLKNGKYNDKFMKMKSGIRRLAKEIENEVNQTLWEEISMAINAPNNMFYYAGLPTLKNKTSFLMSDDILHRINPKNI